MYHCTFSERKAPDSLESFSSPDTVSLVGQLEMIRVMGAWRELSVYKANPAKIVNPL